MLNFTYLHVHIFVFVVLELHILYIMVETLIISTVVVKGLLPRGAHAHSGVKQSVLSGVCQWPKKIVMPTKRSIYGFIYVRAVGIG